MNESAVAIGNTPLAIERMPIVPRIAGSGLHAEHSAWIIDRPAMQRKPRKAVKRKLQGIRYTPNGIARNVARIVCVDDSQLAVVISHYRSRIRKLEAKYDRANANYPNGKLRRIRCMQCIGVLDATIFGVNYAGQRVYVNQACLIDWIQSGAVKSTDGIAMVPPMRKRRKRDIETDLDVLQQRYIWRKLSRRKPKPERIAAMQAHKANANGMGLAQEAYRLATIEGHRDGIKLAYAWLYSGSLETAIQETFGPAKLSKEVNRFLARLVLEPYLASKL